jgi:predicted lipoprotein with Yx(FWY)xxD motif
VSVIRHKIGLTGVLVGAVIATAGCGAYNNLIDGIPAAGTGNAPQGGVKTATSAGADDVVDSAPVIGLDDALVNNQGYVFYTYSSDHRDRVSCTKTCAKVHPPARVPQGTKPNAAGGVKQHMLGTVPDPNAKGKEVITYHGWPLYTYAADPEKHWPTAQGTRSASGGKFYVIHPSGKRDMGPPPNIPGSD